MLPWLVDMLALTCAGSVGTLPVRGGLFGLLALSADGRVLAVGAQVGRRREGGQLSRRRRGGAGARTVGVVVAADAVLLSESRLVMTTVATTAPITTIAATADPTIV